MSPRTWARWEVMGAPPGAIKLFRIVNELDKPKTLSNQSSANEGAAPQGVALFHGRSKQEVNV